MTVIVDGTAGITFPNSSTQTSAGASLTIPSFTTTIGVGAATASASGAGVTFPATQSDSSNANTLDDYEEGTWTPTFTPASGTFAGVSSSGLYTKIGRTVFILGKVGCSGVGSGSGNVLVGSFPFNTQSSLLGTGFYITEWYQGTIGGTFPCLRFEGNPTACVIWAGNLNGSGDARLTAAGIASGGLNISFCGTYQV